MPDMLMSTHIGHTGMSDNFRGHSFFSPSECVNQEIAKL